MNQNGAARGGILCHPNGLGTNDMLLLGCIVNLYYDTPFLDCLLLPVGSLGSSRPTWRWTSKASSFHTIYSRFYFAGWLVSTILRSDAVIKGVFVDSSYMAAGSAVALSFQFSFVVSDP
jgi:hypothetical protein